jgi:hypothetical protein
VQSDSVLELSHRPQHQILGSLPSDITEHAVWYSLTQLEVNSRVLYGNDNYNFLPHILRAAGPESYLYAAMRSVAAINLANRSPTVDMRSVVDSEYAKAVSGVTAALADPEQYLKDETLVAVWLLGMREVRPKHLIFPLTKLTVILPSSWPVLPAQVALTPTGSPCTRHTLMGP